MRMVLKSHASLSRDDIEIFQKRQNIRPKQVASIHYDGIRYVLWYWTME